MASGFGNRTFGDSLTGLDETWGLGDDDVIETVTVATSGIPIPRYMADFDDVENELIDFDPDLDW